MQTVGMDMRSSVFLVEMCGLTNVCCFSTGDLHRSWAHGPEGKEDESNK